MTLEEFITNWQDGSTTIEVRTSGSTGEPKALRVEKRRMLASARITCDYLNLHPGDKALLCLPLDFIAGKMMAVRAIERSLTLTAIEPTGHPLAVADGDFDLAAMVPLQIYNTLQSPAERERLAHIRHLLIGGGALDPSVEQQLCALPTNVWVTYGMTETLSHIALRRVGERWYNPFDGVEVDVNSDGCLIINAPAVCPEVLTTNDRAVLAPDGRRFRILGRRDNVVCSGGLKLQIEEIEGLLGQHADFPFAITKVPDPKYTEAVALLFVGDEEQARQAVRHLPPHMRPRLYVAVAELPMTATGKIARARAEQIAKERKM